jgi:M6 family metalloprotease-like protein
VKRQFLVAVIAISLLYSCASSVRAEELRDIPSNESGSVSCCGTEASVIEEMHGLLVQRKFSTPPPTDTISTFAAMPTLNANTLTPSTGDVRMLVLPIAYPNYPEHKENFDIEKETQTFFAPYDPSKPKGSDQSVRGYYYQSSNGRLNITGTVLPAYEAPLPSTEYEYEMDRQDLIKDALKSYVANGLDLSEYDSDGDGNVDAVVVISLRPIAPGHWWPKMIVTHFEIGDHFVGQIIHAGVEEDSLGTYKHEIGHLLGLPDAYTGGFGNLVLDNSLLDLMGTGSYYINAYFKYLLGWIDPVIVTNDDEKRRIELSAVEQYNDGSDGTARAVVIIPEKTALPFCEYFIAEYRMGGVTGVESIYDRSPGIVIWHCRAYVDSTKAYMPYKYPSSYLEPVYRSRGSKYSENDLFCAGDEFRDAESRFSGGRTGIYLKVDEVSGEKAAVTVGFKTPNRLPGPEITVTPLCKATNAAAISVDSVPVYQVEVKMGDTKPSNDILDEISLIVMGLNTEGEVEAYTSEETQMGKHKNPMTIKIHTAIGEGAVYIHIPAGTLNYNVKDSAAVTSEKIYIDNTPPRISLQGANPQKLQQGETYVELGAIATDNLDPEIEGKLEIDAGEVNTAVAGSYTVTYSVEDHAGHTASAKRTVIVEAGPPPHEHSFSSDWTSDGTGHWHACECGEKSDFAAHDEEIDQAVESTCTAQGKTEGSHCSVCAYVLKAQTATPLKEHIYSNDWVTNANEHWRECTVCRKKTGREVHTEDNGSVTKPPTEEETGVRTYRCSLCGYEMRTEEIDRLEPSHTHSYPDRWTSDETEHWRECECGERSERAAHQEERLPGIEPTCSLPGKTEGSRCAVCEKILIAQTEIPERKHKISDEWSYGTYYEAELGHWHECTNDNCDDLFDLEPHTMDGGVVTTPPTSSKPGVRTYTCEVCKWSRTETIPATGGGSSGGGGGGGSVSAPTQYDITLPGEITGGSVKAEPRKAKKGTTVTLTVEAEEGYELEEIQATDKRGKEIALEEKEGKYSFAMPASHVKVTVLFREKPKEEVPPPPKEEPEPVALPFTDVTEKAWYYDAVREIYSRGIMTGLSGTRFAPELPASRGMVVTMLYRMEGEPAVSAEGRFTDVPEKQYYAPAVAWATEAGLIQGYGDGTFRPDESITREQLVTILYRYGERRGYDMTRRADLSGFFDVGQISPYARESMSWAKAAGLLNGADWGGIDPKGRAERGQIAAILGRFLGRQ